MVSYLWIFYSAALVAFRHFGPLGHSTLSRVSRIFLRFIGYHPSKSDEPDEIEAHDPVGVDSASIALPHIHFRAAPSTRLAVSGSWGFCPILQS